MLVAEPVIGVVAGLTFHSSASTIGLPVLPSTGRSRLPLSEFIKNTDIPEEFEHDLDALVALVRPGFDISEYEADSVRTVVNDLLPRVADIFEALPGITNTIEMQSFNAVPSRRGLSWGHRADNEPEQLFESDKEHHGYAIAKPTTPPSKLYA
ncbi:hypothetical protein MN608_08619 [Microdochium nivale]|nr:hypothetical protein MN608_08619 [Microdochium nivale]